MQRRYFELFDVRRDHALLLPPHETPVSSSAACCDHCGLPAEQAMPGEGEFAGQMFCSSCWAAWEQAAAWHGPSLEELLEELDRLDLEDETKWQHAAARGPP